MKKISEDSVVKVCFFLALAVLIVGCDIHTGRFLLETMEDGGGPALFLIAFGIICAVFYTWLAINSANATRRTVALICKLTVMATMLICAFAINSYKREAKAAVDQKAEKIVESKAEIELEKERLRIEKERAALHQQESQSLVASVVEVKKQTGSTKLADGVLSARSAKADPTQAPASTPQTAEQIKTSAGLQREGVDYKKEITHWFSEFARGPITWFPGTVHGITFGIMVIFIVLTIGGSVAQSSEQPATTRQPIAMSPPAPMPATAKQNNTTFTGGGNFQQPPQ